MKRSVGIFRLSFPEASETFIRAQMGAYERYRPHVYTKRQITKSQWPVSAVSDAGKWAERLFLATRSTKWHAQSAGHAPNLLHAHFGVDGVYALPLADQLNIPLITTFHGFDILTRLAWWARHPSFPVAVYLAHLKQLKVRGACFIAVSRYIEHALLNAGFDKKRIVQHYIGVDTARFQPAFDKRDSKNRYLLCVGRHVEVKGIDVLLRAFARIANKHPDVLLLQVGSGPLTRSLVALAQALGIDKRVRFMGTQPQERVIELLQEAEVFVLPSLTQKSGRTEALGIVFNEASACAVPVASTFSGGIPEVVLHGETGLLCPEGDDASLAENLDHLLSDRALGETLGQRGRELVRESFDLRRQTAKLELIYDKVTK